MKTITLLFVISLFINGVFGDEVKSVSVMEGDSLTLHTNDADIQAADDVTVIWTYKKTRIARINRKANRAPIYDDALNGKFKDRLMMNDQTGDLTITNISTRTTDSGLYEVQITVESKNIHKSFDVKGVSNPESDQQKSVLVKDGDYVTLLADVHYIKKYDEILWRFQGIRIAEFNKSASKISEDERFRDKLQLDVQTGSLQIKNIRTDLSGLYEVDLTSSGYTIHQFFTVTVSGEVKSVSAINGDPLTINTDVPDIKTYDQILLIFGCEDRIAEANKQNKQFTLYGRIRDGLKLNDQTGDLTITDIRYEDAGLYELKMSSRRRTIQRRFSVIISERGLSSGAVAGICVFIILLIAAAAAAAAAAGVIYYRRKIAEMGTKLEVDEGKSADLKTEVTDIQRDDLIEWKFRKTLIAKINPANNISSTYDDDLFRDKLKLNDQTGDLNISDFREKHEGDYKLKIIRGGKRSYKRFRVFVRFTKLEVDEGKSVDLKTEVTDIQTDDDLIEWRFRKTLIAKINPANNISSTSDKGLFRDKLNLNPQTGDLNINDFREKHEGVYKLKIIRGGKRSYKRFFVSVRYERLKVYEGSSVNLETEVTDIKIVDLIEWRFGETLIAQINPANNISSTYDGDDDQFRDNLKLNDQTGDLTISDSTWDHSGEYKLKIIRDGKFLFSKRFIVSVTDKIERVSVNECDSYTLKNTLTDIKKDDVIEWRFEETLIAKINSANNIFRTYDDDYVIFRGKLKLNHQTGDLNINDIIWEHEGVYKLKIIRDGKTSYKRFNVILKDQIQQLLVYEGQSVPLKTKVTDIQRDEKIEWRFGETLIAEINPANNIFSTYEGDDDLFRDKLTLNHQTGDLTINDIKREHGGVFKLKITRDGETSYKRFSVSVREEIETEPLIEGTSVTSSRREDPEEKRGGDSVEIEMSSLPKSSHGKTTESSASFTH